MEFNFVRALGIRVIEVEDLGRDAQYLPKLGFLLIEASLDHEYRQRVSDRVLAHVQP